MKEREVAIIHEMNKKAKIIVETPHGLTKEVEAQNIVKQGTVLGPQMCCANTDQ